MTIIEIKDCKRKDVPIYYRRVFTGIAVVEALGKAQDVPIDWTIETSPLGTKETTITLLEEVDYPRLPLMQELKAKIEALDAQGQLPL
ncbi:MAG: hypothetical protein LBD22_06545 [Spirochaetaceae bacterium]|jgi:hypothetical protein|nr:hypothetical protein [Spirochaetaceae bacterium]